MRKLVVGVTVMTLALGSVTVRADTIYMKNGSVIKGKVTVFAEEQFIVALSTGSGRVSQATIFIGDVSKIEFDGAALAQSDVASGHDSAPVRDGGASRVTDAQPVKNDTTSTKKGKSRRDKNEQVATDVSKPVQDNPVRDNPVRDIPVSDNPSRPVDRSVADTPPDKGSDTPPDRAADRPPDRTVDKPVVDTSSDTSQLVRKPAAGSVKSQSVDVLANRDWTSSGVLIRRGDRIRISATGSVTLDPTNNLTSGPEGIDQADSKKLMPDRPTGSLIAVIGADNDEFIFIGRQMEFTAIRDGLLFLSVNEGTLADNTGSFKALIEVESDKKR